MEVKQKGKNKNAHENIGALGGALSASGSVSTLKLVTNIAAAVLGFLFGGCHLVFGAYPLGLSLVSALPVCVWPALIGSVLGSLTAGRSGIIYGMICVLAVFLRVIISGVGRGEDEGTEVKLPFGESVTLRLAAAVISGFVAAIYEILLSGISAEALLFGAAMILIPAVVTAVLSGAFYKCIGVKELLFGPGRIFADESGTRMIIYRISLLAFIFLTSISLKKYDIFGIDPCFIFSAAITLFVAKRFGPLYGAVCGFAASAGVSSLYSLSFTLAGAVAGAIFSFGTVYAVLAGGIALSAWGAYVGGVSGFLEVFPEYIISASFMLPAFRHLERESAPIEDESVRKRATDMVGTMALSYRSKQALSSEMLADMMYRTIPAVCAFCDNEAIVEDYSVFAKLLDEARLSVLGERDMDEGLTDKLEEAFFSCGFKDGVIRAFGDRRKHIICSGEDKDGTLITSPTLKKAIEDAADMRLAAPEYFRRGNMVLMECKADKRYHLEGAYYTTPGDSDEVSGDTVKMFESKDMFAYGLICDGMGSGKEAKKTADFSAGFFKNSVDCGAGADTLIHMLNSIIRRRSEECGVAVDLFSLDLITGEAAFLKSGAAASYVKRSDSLFRIRSETMPLGIIREVDAERITASVKPGDHVIMLSDGVLDQADDGAWLIELLNRPPVQDLAEYASLIVSEAVKRSSTRDDKSALVMRVGEIERP